MTETKTPEMTPSPSLGESKTVTSQSRQSPRNEFMVAVMSMSWQLAVVVLVPIVGGFELDQAFATSPLLVIIGFIVAMAGFTVVVRRQMQIFTPPEVKAVQPNRAKAKGSSK
jgi:F0F1-type ATP synthase assembly protein I